MMDPQLKSSLTTFGVGIVGVFTGWAASSGLIKPEDVPEVTSALMTLGGVIVAGAIGVYKARQHTPEATIKEVNDAKNGVTVVPEAAAKKAGIPSVTEPIKQ